MRGECAAGEGAASLTLCERREARGSREYRLSLGPGPAGRSWERREPGVAGVLGWRRKMKLGSNISGVARFGVIVALCLRLATFAAAQSTTEPRVTVLHAARLLDIRKGTIVSPGEVLVSGDRIVEVGASVKHPAGAEVIDLGDRTLMPGMIDAHVHLFLHPGAEDLQTVQESVPQRTIRATLAARDDLMAGFTAERDMGTEGAGSADTAVRDAINRGDLPGPRLRISGNAINILGGHEDAIGYNPEQHVLPNADYANNADQLVAVMRQQFKEGADRS